VPAAVRELLQDACAASKIDFRRRLNIVNRNHPPVKPKVVFLSFVLVLVGKKKKEAVELSFRLLPLFG
jgi:hypothetical protein